jgi:uncharacterized membrane protein HdeD (DUF308 family)
MVDPRARKPAALLATGGMVALITLWLDSISPSILVGAALIGGGIAAVLISFEAHTVGKGRTPVLIGLAGVVTGGCLLIWPEMGAESSTALLTTYLVVNACLTLVLAGQLRGLRSRARWFTCGLLSAILALSTWYQVPVSGARAAGLAVACNLLAMAWATAASGSLAAERPELADENRNMAI